MSSMSNRISNQNISSAKVKNDPSKRVKFNKEMLAPKKGKFLKKLGL